MSKVKRNGLFVARVLLFGLISCVVLAYATYVVTPKYDYGICSMVNFYAQEEDSIDVLTIGTSLGYAGVNTNVLWSEYGISAYNLCSAEQPYWVSYYLIREALKTQHPKVILLDAKPSAYPKDYAKRGRIVLATYGIRGIRNRIGATLASVESVPQALSYLLGLPQVHSNYKSVTKEDFSFPPSNGGRGSDWKGYIEIDEIEAHQRPSVVWNTSKQNMNEREAEYAEKIFALCREEGIELKIIGFPNPDYATDHKFYNSLWELASGYGFDGINYNDPNLRFGLRYSTDFADWQHLNVKGGITFSRKLGEDLKELYDLPDHRGDAKYESYETCAKKWYSKYPTFVSSGTSENKD